MFEKLIASLSASAVRHAVTAAGGYLVAQGLADMSQMNDLEGSVCFLAAFAFSVFDKWQAKKKLTAAKAV